MSWVLRAAIALLVTSASLAAGSAQSAPPVRATRPGEITIVSKLMAAKYEECRQQANQQHLHLLARHRFLKACRAPR
jgi:hypothetical protein